MCDEFIPPSPESRKSKRRKSRKWSKVSKLRRLEENNNETAISIETTNSSSFLLFSELKSNKICTENSGQEVVKKKPAVNLDAFYYSDSDEEFQIGTKYDYLKDIKLLEKANTIMPKQVRNKIPEKFLRNELIPCSQVLNELNEYYDLIEASTQDVRRNDDKDEPMAMISSPKLFESPPGRMESLKTAENSLKRTHFHSFSPEIIEPIELQPSPRLFESPPGRMESLKTTENPLKRTHFHSFSPEIIHIPGIDPEIEMNDTELFNLCQAADVDFDIQLANLKFSQWTSPTVKQIPSTSRMNPVEQIDMNSQKTIKTYPNFVRKLENFYETDSDSDISIQEARNFNELKTPDCIDLNKSLKVTENLQNLSSFFLQQTQEEKQDEICDGVFRYYQLLKQLKQKEYRMIEWFRKKRNFHLDNVEDFAGFKGFPEISDDSISLDSSNDNISMPEEELNQNNDSTDIFLQEMWNNLMETDSNIPSNEVLEKNEIVNGHNPSSGTPKQSQNLNKFLDEDDELFSENNIESESQLIKNSRKTILQNTNYQTSQKFLIPEFELATKKAIPSTSNGQNPIKNIFSNIDLNENYDFQLNECIEDFLKHKQNRNRERLNRIVPKSKEILNNLDFRKENKLPGFQLASGKTVSISEEARRKGEQILVDIVTGIPSPDEVNKENLNQFEFESISGKPIQACDRGDRVTDTQIDETDIKNITTPKSGSKFNQFSSGFKSAAGKQIHVSENARVKGEQVLLDIVTDTPIDVTDMMDITTPKLGTKFNQFSSGFKSAAGKQIHISENARVKGEQLLLDIVTDTPVDVTDLRDITTPKSSTKFNQFSSGFKSAAGKQIHISENARSKAEQVLSDIITDTEIDETDIKNFTTPKLSTNFIQFSSGFKSAAGKQIHVSENGRVKGEQLLLDIVTDTPIDVTDLRDITTPKSGTKFNQFSSGFKSATGKQIHISENARSKAEEILKDIDNFDIPLLNENQSEKSSKFSENVLTSSNLHKIPATKLKFSTKKFHPPTRLDENKQFTPIKIKERNDNFSTTPNLKEFFNSVTKSSTPRTYPNPRTANDIKSFSLTQQEITASTEALLEDEFNDFKKLSWTTDEENAEFYEIPDDLKQQREIQRNKQIDLIKSKTGKMKIQSGLLYKKKLSRNRIKLKDFVNNESPRNYTRNELIEFGIPEGICNLTNSNCFEFKFLGKLYFSNEFLTKVLIPIENQTNLILDNRNSCGLNEIRNAFLTIPTVLPSLIPKNWIENHYKMLLLKLGWMEISFPDKFLKICNPETILEQLKYRYDLEIDHFQRSALRKILECDITATKRMILIILDIYEINNQKYLLLSDRWYSIRTEIDLSMENLIRTGKIKIGTKLMIQSAELINCEQGCSPLQIPDNVYLKIHTNSTRRTKWDCKLGFYSISKSFLIRLDSISENGGIITKLKLCCIRRYPSIYRETKDDKSSFHSEKVEERLRKYDEGSKFENIEILFSQVQKEIESEEKDIKPKSFSFVKNIKNIHDPAELLELINSGCDLEDIMIDLTPEQREQLEKYQQEIYTHRMDEINKRVKDRLQKQTTHRKSIELLKIRVIDAIQPHKTAILSIWHPSDDIKELLQEGVCFELTNSSPIGLHSDGIQLITTKLTKYKKLNTKLNTNLGIFRKIIQLEEIYHRNFKPDFNELDIFGLIIRITEPDLKKFQSIYITDFSQNILCIKFWINLEKYAFNDIIKCNAFIALQNVQWRTNSTINQIYDVYATDLTICTENPKSEQMKIAIKQLRQQFSAINLSEFIENSCRKLDETISISKKHSNSSFNLNLSNSNIPSPNSSLIKDKVSIQNRIEHLKVYGMPPPISPISPLTIHNRNVRKPFKLPTILNYNESLDEKR